MGHRARFCHTRDLRANRQRQPTPARPRLLGHSPVGRAQSKALWRPLLWRQRFNDLATVPLPGSGRNHSVSGVAFGSGGVLCIQLCLSYWQSGWVKLINPDWRSGRALWEVFACTHYPVSTTTRRWAEHPRLLWAMGWLIMLVEFCFPVSLYYSASLYAALIFMGVFHLANAWFWPQSLFMDLAGHLSYGDRLCAYHGGIYAAVNHSPIVTVIHLVFIRAS